MQGRAQGNPQHLATDSLRVKMSQGGCFASTTRCSEALPEHNLRLRTLIRTRAVSGSSGTIDRFWARAVNIHVFIILINPRPN